MNRLLLLLLASLGAAPLAAQGTRTLQSTPIDRVVAVVGSRSILWSEVVEAVGQRRARGEDVPQDSVGQLDYAKRLVQELIDEEILVSRALQDTSITVADADLTSTVEEQLKRLRGNFPNEAEFLRALRGAGFGNLEEYRRWLTEQARRGELQRRFVRKMQSEGKMVPVAVSDAEVTEAYNNQKEKLPKRPPAVVFRQIVIPTLASEPAKRAAKAKAESLLVEIRGGADFEQVARRESMDPQSKEQGGDLGWNRRDQTVPEFDRVLFSLRPGQISSVTETQYGFHIIRVDRVKPSEVKARHVLIMPKYDSTDIARSRALADSVLRLWRSGTPYDTLVARFHDRDEMEGSLDPFPRSQLPESYAKAFEGKQTGEFIGPFPIEDRQRGVPKFVLAQLTQVIEAGDYTVEDLREQIRQNLSQERAFRRLIDRLRKETYVAVMPIEGMVGR